MKQLTFNHVRTLIVCISSLFVMLLFSACSGIAGTTTTNGTTTITGSIKSVNASTHSVVLDVSGQQVTVGNLTDQQIAALQPQVGK
jgi:type 1 fimbria pilin